MYIIIKLYIIIIQNWILLNNFTFWISLQLTYGWDVWAPTIPSSHFWALISAIWRWVSDECEKTHAFSSSADNGSLRLMSKELWWILLESKCLSSRAASPGPNWGEKSNIGDYLESFPHLLTTGELCNSPKESLDCDWKVCKSKGGRTPGADKHDCNQKSSNLSWTVQREINSDIIYKESSWQRCLKLRSFRMTSKRIIKSLSDDWAQKWLISLSK